MKDKDILYLRALAKRTIKTMCQCAVGYLSSAALISDIDWKMVLSATVLSGIVCILNNIGGLPEVDLVADNGIDELDLMDDEGVE